MSFSGRTHSKEARQRISEASSARKRPPMPEHVKLALFKANKGRKKSTEEIEAIRKSHIGIPISEDHKRRLHEGRKKYVMPEETRRQIAEKLYGKCYITEDGKRRQRESMLNNTFATKIKDPAARQRAYDSYCDWLSKGKTKKSFTYIEDDLMCTYNTIELYIKDNPEEFDPLKKEIAYAKGCARWEQIVDETGEGSRKDASVPTLNMIMRNKYKWDTAEHERDAEGSRSDLNRFSQQRSKERDESQSTPQTDRSESRAE